MNRPQRVLLSCLLMFALVAFSCDSDESANDAMAGTEQGPCLENDTCNVGLVCASNICVQPPDQSDMSQSDAGTDTSVVPDAAADTAMVPDATASDTAQDIGASDTGSADTGTADTGNDDTNQPPDLISDAAPDLADQVPTVQINHPSDGETREVNLNVPLAGVSTDPQDGQLTGMSLEWSTDVDGVVASGEMGGWVPTTTGAHVLTLTATDTDGNMATDSITITVAAP